MAEKSILELAVEGLERYSPSLDHGDVVMLDDAAWGDYLDRDQVLEVVRRYVSMEAAPARADTIPCHQRACVLPSGHPGAHFARAWNGMWV